MGRRLSWASALARAQRLTESRNNAKPTPKRATEPQALRRKVPEGSRRSSGVLPPFCKRKHTAEGVHRRRCCKPKRCFEACSDVCGAPTVLHHVQLKPSTSDNCQTIARRPALPRASELRIPTQIIIIIIIRVRKAVCKRKTNETHVHPCSAFRRLQQLHLQPVGSAPQAGIRCAPLRPHREFRSVRRRVLSALLTESSGCLGSLCDAARIIPALQSHSDTLESLPRPLTHRNRLPTISSRCL